MKNFAMLWRRGPGSGSAAVACCLALPVGLLHARAVADVLIVAIDLLFLIGVVRGGRWGLLRGPFAAASLIWWVWLVFCSLRAGAGIGAAAAAIRLPLLAVALGGWCLETERRRALVWASLAGCALWIGLECWQQALTGTDLLGYARWGDGALTGPFFKPRAGPAFILLLFPALLPPVCALLDHPARLGRLAGPGLLALAAATVVMIGQRMPTALLVLGLGATAILLPRLRWPTLAAFAVGGLLLAATPVLSPPTFTKLVLRFSDQMAHFEASSYGQIYRHATALVLEHPWFGWGFDGFRRVCGHAEGTPESGDCSIHPHNLYLQAAVEAGLPGLAAFAAMIGAALLALGRDTGRFAAPRRVGIFVAVLLAFWPIASTSAFTALPNAGWIFLILGLGFAEAPRRPG